MIDIGEDPIIHLSRRALLIGATAGAVAVGFPGVIAYLDWCRIIHAFAAPLGRLWSLGKAKVRHRGRGRATAAGWR